jgi:hypothetical protein
MAKKTNWEIVELLMEQLKQEEIAFFSYSEIYTWGCSDIQTFEFSAASGLRFRGWVWALGARCLGFRVLGLGAVCLLWGPGVTRQGLGPLGLSSDARLGFRV